MKGKNKCKILKEIRQKIADENDIPYVTRECTYQGDCLGTCPKCEAELRYLEQELEKRRSLGKTVAVAAVAASLSFSLAACVPGTGSGSAGNNDPSLPVPNPPFSTQEVLKGEFPQETEEPLMGQTEPQELEGEPVPAELMGDVAYLPGSLPVESMPVDQAPETTEAR
ncbi:MAG: hypothetical protein J5789_00785 [Oscillospiraceae bacterium]|nr:hypothetical protein [Oscillospiraceae bacterium]